MLFTELYEDLSPRERFEQTPPVTGRLVIFDIDDTLVNTTTKVGVRKNGRIIKQLNSHDFTHYELQPGEEFDFGGFRDAREFFTQARPIPGMMRQLKRDIESGNKVIMLTARSDFNDRDVFLDTFRQYGIDMDRIHVYRAGNLVTRAATEEKKKMILKHLLGKHAYEKVIMYDDSVPNLNAFLSLKQDFPYTEFYAWHVDPSGQADEYHRTGLDEGVRDTLAGLALGAGVALGSAGAADQVPSTKIEPIVATVVINGETKKLDLTPKRFNDVREAEKWLDKFMADRNIMDWQGKIERGTPGSGTYQRLTISGAGGLRKPKLVDEGLRDTIAGLALGAGVAMGGGAEAKPNVERMVVSPGQTVYSIARAFDTTPEAIQRANRLDRNFSIRPGQTLIIPQPGVKLAKPGAASAAKPAVQQPKTAQVKKMRTLTGTKAEALLQRTALQSGLRGIELAAFLSQTKHESWNFSRMTEQRSDASAERMYGVRHSPAKAKELGNVKNGDGARYKGRGYIQLTGRDNYYRAGRALGLDLVRNPNLAADPETAAKIAVWYWKSRVAPKVDNFSDVRAVTRPINKGLDQLAKRQAAFLAYVDLLGLESQT